MLRIGHVAYINTYPLFARILSKRPPYFRLLSAPPAIINHAMQKRQVDVAIMSSAAFLRRSKHYFLYPHLGIIGQGAVHSVLLYSKRPAHELHRGSVALTCESATSVQLTQLLFKHRWKATPRFFSSSTPEKESCDAYLLIGNKALSHTSSYPYCYDLSQVWFEWTGLPFVFAVFGVRKDLCPSLHPHLLFFFNNLEKTLREFETDPQCFVEKAQRLSQLPLQQITHYFTHLRYRFAHPELASLKTFQRLLQIPAPFSYLPPFWRRP
jgi:chorismate dehydratase